MDLQPSVRLLLDKMIKKYIFTKQNFIDTHIKNE